MRRSGTLFVRLAGALSLLLDCTAWVGPERHRAGVRPAGRRRAGGSRSRLHREPLIGRPPGASDRGHSVRRPAGDDAPAPVEALDGDRYDRRRLGKPDVDRDASPPAPSGLIACRKTTRKPVGQA